MTSFRVELALPPSINSAYETHVGGRHLSKRAREWKIAAGWELRLAARRFGGLTGGYTFQILVPQKMRGDATNRIKLAEDLLVAHGITPDDRNTTDGRATRSAEVPTGRCIVIVESAL